MNSSGPKPRRRLPFLILWILAILLLGTVLAVHSFRSTEQRLRADVMQNAGYLAETLNPQRLRALSAAEDPSQTVEYTRLEHQLTKVLLLDPRLQWIGLTQIDPVTDQHRSLLDISRGDIDTSALSQWLDPVCVELCRSSWDKGRVQISAPDLALAEPLIIGCSAVTLPTEPVPTILIQVAVPSSPIRLQAIAEATPPASICLLLAAGLWIAMACRSRLSTSHAHRQPQTVVCDAATTVFVGICLTALITLIVVRHIDSHNQQEFVNLARSHEARMLESFTKIRDVGTQSIGGLIVASDEVSAAEFAHFAKHLQAFRGVTAWAWAVPVSGDELATLEAHIRSRDGIPDFKVWQSDESGGRVAVEPADIHFPLILAAPEAAAGRIRGLDMRSRPFSHQMVLQATAARLPLASPPLPLLHTPEQTLGIIIYHPVFSTDDPDHLLGFVCAGLPMSELSATLFPKSPAINMDLFVATDDGQWTLIASSDDNPPPLIEPEPTGRIRPLTVFGNTYAVRTRPPCPQWFNAFVGPAWVATLLGLMTTAGAAFIIFMLGRKRDEDIARQEERRLRLLFENVASVAVQGFQPDGTVVYWNKAAESLYGYSAEEAVGRNLMDLIVAAENRPAMADDIRQMVTSRQPVPPAQISLQCKNGDKIEAYTSYAVIDVPNQPLQIYAIDVDMSAIARARKRLELLAQALDSAANGVVITDREGVIEWVNAAFCELSGYTKNEAIGQRVATLVKSGKHDEAFYQRLWQVILGGEVWSGEITNRKKDGTLYPEEVTITPVAGIDGQINHFIAIKRDLTEEKAHEARILRTQRMESIGTLAGGIAHDINNALTPILMILDSIRSATEAAQREPLLKIIESSVERSAAMISQLLTFARGIEGEHVDLDLKTIAAEMETFLKETLPKDISIRLTIADDLLPVHGDPTQIHQALLNLCVNARDAMPSGGKLELTLENTLTSPVNPLDPPRQMVKITVSDSGCGIPDNIKERIFDPFFTTKEVGKGSGLGLSTTHSIIKGHGGYIEVTSQPNQGTSFELFLPAATAPAVTDNQQPQMTPAQNQTHHTILVADDEPFMRQTLELVLIDAGFDVIVAEDGAMALEIFKRDPDAISLVITDMAMPVMDGRTAVKAMLAIRPHLPVIGTSGMPSPEDTQAGIQHFISKPFKPDELLAIINKALADPGD